MHIDRVDMRRSEVAARQKNKDSRLAPLTLPPRRASRLLLLMMDDSIRIRAILNPS
jgi:hypothetical protein